MTSSRLGRQTRLVFSAEFDLYYGSAAAAGTVVVMAGAGPAIVAVSSIPGVEPVVDVAMVSSVPDPGPGPWTSH
jgi:hypothetical protein